MKEYRWQRQYADALREVAPSKMEERIAAAENAIHDRLEDSLRRSRHREVPIAWTADGRSLFVYRLGQVPANVYKVELATGRKQPWKQLVPPDVSGVTDVSAIFITPDGNNYVYEYGRTRSDLYLVNDVK
jgi:hypothetical protein